MVNQIAEWFTRKQVNKLVVPSEEREIYSYGYLLLLEVMINIFISLISAIVLKQLSCLFLFSCVFIPLRIYCGGWHANETWKCSLLSNLMIISVMIIVKFEWFIRELWIIGLIEVIGFLTVCKFAPVEHPNKPLNNKEKEVYGRICKGVYCIQLIFALVSLSYNNYEVFQIIWIAHALTVVSLGAGKYSMKLQNKQKNN